MTNEHNSAAPQSIAVEVEMTVAKFLKLHNDFAALLREENEVLMAKRYDALADITNRKFPIIEAYQADIRYLQHNEAVLKTIGEDVKAQLRAANAERAELTLKNIELLKLNQGSSERAMKMIVEAMQETKASSKFYSNGGAVVMDKQVSRSHSYNSVI